MLQRCAAFCKIAEIGPKIAGPCGHRGSTPSRHQEANPMATVSHLKKSRSVQYLGV